MKADLIVRDNEHFLELHKHGGLKGKLLEVPSFSNDGDPVLVNLSGRLRSRDGKATELIDKIEKTMLQPLKEVLFEQSLEFYKGFKEGRNKKRKFTLLSKTGNKPLDIWLDSYAQLSPVKNRKSLRGYVFSLEVDEVTNALKRIIDELVTYDGWADAITDEALIKIDIEHFPALLLSRKISIREMEYSHIVRNLQGCVEQLTDVTGSASQNALVSDVGRTNDLLIFSVAHLSETRRRKASHYRNIYLKILTFGSTHRYWVSTYSDRNAPRLQFRAIGSEAIEKAIESGFTKDRKPILTSIWSRFISSTSIGQTLNFPIQIRLLFEYVLTKERASRGGHRRVMEQLSKSVGLGYPLEMCDPINKQIESSNRLNWYERYSMVERNGHLSVEATVDTSTDDSVQPLTKEWLEALEMFHEQKDSSDGHKQEIMHFVKWAVAYRGALSPWDIEPIDLYDPFSFSDTPDCYFDYVNNAKNVKSKKTKRQRWGIAKDLYKRVANVLTLKNEKVVSPFKSLPKVDFTGRGKRRKTPRARITSIVIDKMVDIICSFDSDGIPTYKWAEDLSLAALNSKHSQQRTDHFFCVESNDYVFCPSRASILAFLLLLPLRGVQARWLDQGCFDEKRFDVATKAFKENNSPLKDFESEYRIKQRDVNGRDVGVIQPASNDLLSGASEFSIYVNTNKTQLWNPDDRNGYELPWPYLQNPKHAYEKSLNYPYSVLFEQLRWLEKYSPSAQPLRFDHLPADRERVTSARGYLANVPYMLPVFRDLTETVAYRIDGKQIVTNPPVSKIKIERIFDELCIETEKRLKEEGLDVVLTNSEGESIFDIHTLRVAGISHLLDIGVPLHIVSEFIAGHTSVFMTLGYSKSESDAIKEKLLKANSSKFTPSASENVLLGEERAKLFAPNDKGHDIDLGKRNIATFAPVEGGMCPLGGKGCAGCDEGMPSPNEDGEFIPVQGGCGNCRFWLTSEDFLLEQMLELNRIMYIMKESSRDVKFFHETIEEAEWDLEDAETPQERKKLTLKITSIRAKIKALEESTMPLMTAWTRRYLAAKLSEEQKLANNSDSGDKPTLIGDIDITTNLKSGSDWELAHAVVEQAYLLPKGSVPIPENPARTLREFMDTIVSNLDTSFLFARIKDKHVANQGALKLADYLNEHFSQGEIHALSDGDLMEISRHKLEDVTKAANLLQSMVDKQLSLPSQKRKMDSDILDEAI